MPQGFSIPLYAKNWEFEPVQGDPFAPAKDYARELRGAPGGSPIAKGMQKDFNDLVQSAEEIVKSFGTVGNALMRGEQELAIGPDGEIAGQIDPKLVDAAATLSGLVGGTGSLARRPSNALGVFGGVNAKTADLDALAHAIKLENAGVEPERIWRMTGWGRGADRKWRFEIPDHASKYDDNALRPSSDDELRIARETREKIAKEAGFESYRQMWDAANGSSYFSPNDQVRALKALEGVNAKVSRAVGDETTLGEILDHPKLFEAYPKLKDIPVRRVERSDVGGYYNPTNNYIAATPKGSTLSGALSASPGQGHSIVLHEVQHAIQSREGFAHGGSANDPEVVEIGRKIIEGLEARHKELKEKIASDHSPSEDDAIEYAWLTRVLHNAREAGPGQTGYYSLSGEVEARNVQKRHGWGISHQAPWLSEDTPRRVQVNRFVSAWERKAHE